MTYHGVILLLTGYQADEEHILKQYRAIVDKSASLRYPNSGAVPLTIHSRRLEARYPTGSLWILNRVRGFQGY